ncbi:hypothetical protein GCM10028819_51960 [Spirosoma humi]
MSTMFNFVIDCEDAKLAEYTSVNSLYEYTSKNVDSAFEISYRGDYLWCLQTFLILSKRKNISVQCSNKLMKNAVNIVHSDTLLKLKGNASFFIVCVQADYPRRRWAHYTLVQNKNQLRTNSFFIPLWIQPGLIKRNINRKGIQRVAYSGQTWNGNFAGSETSWKHLFEPNNIEFTTLSAESWHDMSNIDVLIALRGFNSNPYDTKPPSKLFNAWHAEIPFVGGNDSAYKQVGNPDEDYLLATNPQEVLAVVSRLQNDPELYSKLVQNGNKKAVQYNEVTIATIWEEALTGPVMDRYGKWKSNRSYESIRFRLTQGIGLLEHQTKQLIKSILRFKK